MWTFSCYDDGRIGNMWERWFADQDKRTKARHRVVFDYLEPRGRHQWKPPYFKSLKNMDGCGEILISPTLEYRLFGFFKEIGNHFAF
jgi:hypothetical protein